MAITVEVKPDLSAFREASIDELATQLCDGFNVPGQTDDVVSYARCKAMAAALLERHWIVPK